MSRKRKERCASCVRWCPGDCWFSNYRGVYAPGTCSATGKPVDNTHHACRFYDKNEKLGIIRFFNREELEGTYCR